VTISIEEGNRRLLVLADFLEKLPPERFDFSRWVGSDWKGARDLSCGTTACAFGWATTALPEADLWLRGDGYAYVCHGTWKGDPNFDATVDAADKAFGIEVDDLELLFTPCDHDDEEHEESDCCDQLPESASASDVAAHIRQFVAGRK
jgi:hypothetical protein